MFLVFERKKRVEKLGRGQNSEKNVVLLVCGVPGAIYSPEMRFEAAALKGQKKCGS